MNTMLKMILISINTLLPLNFLAQLKAYPDTTRIKDTVARTTFTVPEVMPEFPGGTQKMFKYLLDNFTNKVTISKDQVTNFRSPAVKWTVDETGKVINTKIVRSSNISSVDNLLIEVVNKMPVWKPAEQNHKKVKYDFTIPIQICFR